MKSQDFTGKYALTLHTDPHTEENYIKLPVADLAELGYMQQAILDKKNWKVYLNGLNLKITSRKASPIF